ncbi:MAG TPA: glycosyltransferase, partial [Candidatus Nanoarchaeia archaeon]|nr:glycosyltransferase [Candidatus Nanoarchaeia archaeon]
MATLCLCMIAKNEEKDIQQLLSELKPYTDQIVLAVDHRTTDRTRDVAKKFGAQVFDIRWCDDFSAARNESLAKATMDWILVLDA